MPDTDRSEPEQTDLGGPMSFPPSPTRGEYIWTYSGRKFFFNDENPDISIIDIAHALSLICRWTGHAREFYSVAEHCVRCSVYPSSWEQYLLTHEEEGRSRTWVEPAHALRKLLHDAAEAYITDLSRPVKNIITFRNEPSVLEVIRRHHAGFVPHYEKLDDHITRAIWRRYGLDPMGTTEAKAVKEADLALAITEARDLLGQTSIAHYEGARPLKGTIKPWAPGVAEEQFLSRFNELM